MPFKKNVSKKTNFKRKAKVGFKKPSKALTKAVESIIHKQAETKESYTTSGNSLVLFNSPINFSTDVQEIFPSVNVGDGDNARTGDQIRAQSLTIKGFLNMGILSDVNNVNNRRIAIRLMVIQPRRYTNYPDIKANITSWSPTLLKKGGGTVGYTGVLTDMYAPINSDAIIKYFDKTYIMSQSYLYQRFDSYSGGTTVNTNIAAATDVYRTIKPFTINLKLRNKLLRYDDSISSGLLPTNYCPCMLIGYTHLDGSSADQTNTQVGLMFESFLKYEDM